MNPLKVLAAVVAAVPRLIRAIRSARAKGSKLDAPLGESEAARALRLEEDRRARERERRGPG